MSASLHELRLIAGSVDQLVADLDLGGFYDRKIYAEAVVIAHSNRNKSVEERQTLALRCAVVVRGLVYGLLREAETNVENDMGKSGRNIPTPGQA